MKKTVFLSLLITLVGLAAACGGKHEAVEEKPVTVTGVPVEAVKASSIEDSYEAVGAVQARNSTVISSKVVGTITSMRVREGDRVRAGQVLIEVENRDARAQVDKAQAGLREAQTSTDELDRNIRAAEAGKAAAEANRRLAQSTLKRYQGLRERKSISDQEFDEVQAKAQVADAEVDRADKMLQVLEARRKMVEARIDQAKADVSGAQVYAGYARITSPIDGVVTAKNAEVGTLAAPGAPLLTIENASSFRLEAAVEESRIREIKLNAPAKTVIDALGAEELPGRVVEIVPAANANSRTYTVKIDLPNRPGMRSGMFGKARFAGGQREAILIPAAAVVQRGQLTGVYALDAKGVARLRLITLGKKFGDRIETLSGVTQGDRIVADGAKIEREGVVVQ